MTIDPDSAILLFSTVPVLTWVTGAGGVWVSSDFIHGMVQLARERSNADAIRIRIRKSNKKIEI